MALLSMLMLLLPSLTSPALAMASEDKGFMVVATTLSEKLYELSYRIEVEDSSENSRRSSFTDELLRASLLPKSKEFQRKKSPPPAHNLISRFETTPTLHFQLLQVQTLENSYSHQFKNEKETFQALNSFKTKDLLAKGEGGKGDPADYASFWLVRGDGIYCHLFDKNGSPTGRVVKMLNFRQSLKTDPDSFPDSETGLSQDAMEELMKEIVNQRHTKKAQGSVQTSFVTFATTLDKKQHPVYYKVESDEPTNKATKRRSFTMDLRDVYLLEKTGTDFSHDDLPITYPLLEGQVQTTMTIYLYVTNIEEPKTGTVNERKEKNPKRSPTRQSPSQTPLYFPKNGEHLQVPQLQLNTPEENSPKQLEPVVDNLDSLQDLHGHKSTHMYRFRSYFSPTDRADDEFWLIDGIGIHCYRYRFNAAGDYVGKVNRMALWKSTTLPVIPGPPQNSDQIERIGELMTILKRERLPK